MTTTDELNQDDYYEKVIKPGDDASEKYKAACIEANKDSFIGKKGMLKKGKIFLDSQEFFSLDVEIENQIDGVGTKTHIYMKQFEGLYRSYENDKSPEALSKLLEESTELMNRMLHDFFAMNADDLRDGEMALAMTNIIDINHLDGEKGQIFGEAMALAMSKIIKETGIAIINGETAVLGASQNCAEVVSLVKDKIKNLDIEIFSNETGLKFLQYHLKNADADVLDILAGMSKTIERMKKATAETTKGIKIINDQIEMNLGGAITGMKVNDKLIPLKEGQVIIGFQEIPTESGIIGPRSNGISAIRKAMEGLLGFEWPNMTFGDFVDTVMKNNESDENFKDSLAFKRLDSMMLEIDLDTKLGDIATGKTTVFNPFISEELLLGVSYDKPEVGISRLIHVTGNPVKKIASAVGKENFDIELDITAMTVPQIIRMCQIITGMSDDDVMKKWNMGLPYALICDEKDVDVIIVKSWAKGIKAGVVGQIKKCSSDKPMMNISGIGGSDETKSYMISEAIK
ncbi:MAG: hypothetical protein PHS92_04895 [Candidatus Gracilibacteria bacterium]|nr:hypothetical protein [Candidatus Gracilibacteria bacterium]